MGAKDVRPTCQGTRPSDCLDGTNARIPMPKTGPAEGFRYLHTDSEGEYISYELRDAPPMCVPTTLRSMNLEQMRVLAWLQKYRGDIVTAASKYKVDRRAIAGVIAWEALENVHGAFGGGLRKAAGMIVGPGKPHLLRLDVCGRGDSAAICLTDDNTWPKAAEDAGIIDKQDAGIPFFGGDRAKVMATPEGAIQYIGASMDLIAQIYEKAGSPGICNPPIRHNPVILTNIYQGKDPSEWEARVKKIKPGEELQGGNEMDVWVGSHLQYLQDGVGTP